LPYWAFGFHFSREMADNSPIGIFDSGVGQLSILKETKKILPKENFIIFADYAHHPFGQKTNFQIKKYTLDACKFLQGKHNIKLLIVACNTASVAALEFLRKKIKIATIGVVPAVKPAFEKSKNIRVAIMSTVATAESSYLDRLIQEFANPKNVLKLDCPGLEAAIEASNNKEIDKLLGIYTEKIKRFKAKTVVLGCTHYPLIKNLIAKKLPSEIVLIDSGKAIAKRIKEILTRSDQLSQERLNDIFYTTKDPKIFAKRVSNFLKYKVIANHVVV